MTAQLEVIFLSSEPEVRFGEVCLDGQRLARLEEVVWMRLDHPSRRWRLVCARQ
jgi:hypothetical protein